MQYGTHLHTIFDIQQLVIKVLFGRYGPITFTQQRPTLCTTKRGTPEYTYCTYRI